MASDTKFWSMEVVDQVRAPIDVVWELCSDFVGTDRWYPGVTSTLVSGEPGTPGVVRRLQEITTGPSPNFANEQLLSLDTANHLITYQLLENTWNLKEYKGILKLTPGADPGVTEISWSYQMVPNNETTPEAVAAILGFLFRNGIDHLKLLLEKDETKADGAAQEAKTPTVEPAAAASTDVGESKDGSLTATDEVKAPIDKGVGAEA